MQGENTFVKKHKNNLPIVTIFHGIILGIKDTIFRDLRLFIDYGSSILTFMQVLFWHSIAFSSLSIFFSNCYFLEIR